MQRSPGMGGRVRNTLTRNPSGHRPILRRACRRERRRRPETWVAVSNDTYGALIRQPYPDPLAHLVGGHARRRSHPHSLAYGVTAAMRVPPPHQLASIVVTLPSEQGQIFPSRLRENFGEVGPFAVAGSGNVRRNRQ